MTDAEFESAMLAARNEIDRQLDTELAADPQRDERLLKRTLAATAAYRAEQAQTGQTVQTTMTVERLMQLLRRRLVIDRTITAKANSAMAHGRTLARKRQEVITSAGTGVWLSSENGRQNEHL